jgi:hypothetical protein
VSVTGLEAQRKPVIYSDAFTGRGSVVFTWFRSLVADVRRARDASRLMTKAHALYSEGRYAETSEVVKFARELVGPPEPTVFAYGIITSTRFAAARLLSASAAKAGDRALALDAIGEGLRIWNALKPHLRPSKTVENLTEWEVWAKRYRDSVAGG